MTYLSVWLQWMRVWCSWVSVLLLLLLLLIELLLISLQLMHGAVDKSHRISGVTDRQQTGHCHVAISASSCTRLLNLLMRRRGNGLYLAAWSILVVGVIEHVLSAKSLRFVYELTLLAFAEYLPRSAEPLRDLRVVHLWVLLVETLPPQNEQSVTKYYNRVI